MLHLLWGCYFSAKLEASTKLDIEIWTPDTNDSKRHPSAVLDYALGRSSPGIDCIDTPRHTSYESTASCSNGEGAERQTNPNCCPDSAIQLADSPIASPENCTAEQPEDSSPKTPQMDVDSPNSEELELREANKEREFRDINAPISLHSLANPEIGKTAAEESDKSTWKKSSGMEKKVLHNSSNAAPDCGEHEQGLNIPSMMRFQHLQWYRNVAVILLSSPQNQKHIEPAES
ncbi:hypothetical protein F5884DRAFT_757707 [Xylogone sp. PMI_703]|nr:hypothetical protein F5884DRAFT_757707 [Xylogone sp. PMI_703]